MAGYSRPAPLPTMMKAATTDPFTGLQLTKQRPFTAMEKYEVLNPAEGRSGAMAALPPLPGVGSGLGWRPRRGGGRVVAPGFQMMTPPDDGRRIGSKTGALPALTAQDWINANGGLSNPAASSRMGSLDSFYDDNPDAAASWMRKGGTPIPGFGEGWASDEIKGYADGGVIPEGELALVGERGPELVQSTGATQVVPLKPMTDPNAGVLPTFDPMWEESGLTVDQMFEAQRMGAEPVTGQPGVLRAWLPNERNFSDPVDLPPLPAFPGGEASRPAVAATVRAPLPAWNPPPRELLGQAPEPGSVPVLNPMAMDPWLQTKVNHIAQRELARNPMDLVKLQMGIESAQSQAEARAQQARLKERGLNERHSATLQANADRAAIENNFKLSEESRKAAEFAQQFVNPEVRTVPIEGTNFVMPFAGNKAMGTLPVAGQKQAFELMQLPGTDTYFPAVNGKPDLKSPFTMSAPPAPGQSPTFAPVQKPQATKPEFIQEVVEGEVDPVTGQKGPKVTKHYEIITDANGNRVLRFIPMEADVVRSQSPLYQGGQPAAVTAPAAATVSPTGADAVKSLMSRVK